MIRSLAIVIVALTLLPASAEARKLRFGGGSRAAVPAVQPASNGGLGTGVALGVAAGSRASRAYAATPVSTAGGADPARVPFPSVGAQSPALLRLTAAKDDAQWCRSEVVVGGFCVLN